MKDNILIAFWAVAFTIIYPAVGVVLLFILMGWFLLKELRDDNHQ